MNEEIHEETSGGQREAEKSCRSAPVVGWGKSLLAGVAAAASIVLTLVVWTAIVAGRSPAERALTSLAMPTAALWLLFLAVSVTLFLRRRPWEAGACLILWVVVGVTFNHWVAGAFLRTMELPTDSNPAATITEPLDTVVLLGGYAADNRFGVPELGEDGQRLLLAAQLWHAGKTKTFICTGTGLEGMRNPSAIGRELLVSVGVPSEVIFESSGENTAAEMVGLEAFLRDPPDAWLAKVGRENPGVLADFDASDFRIGLVTSAVHLSRAMRLAEGRDLDFIPVACCLPGSQDESFSPRDLIPSAGAGRKFGAALKERLAKLVGR